MNNTIQATTNISTVDPLKNGRRQAVNRVAIQGFEGSFHQEAARRIFGPQISIHACGNFQDVFKSMAAKETADAAVIAIENSIADSILPNYSLLRNSDLRIAGEVYLHIRQNLLVNPGVALSDIREVHSHPMAILQCLEYLNRYDWKLIETEDTALSAKHIHQRKSKHIAGIASQLAAELFGLHMIAPDIHTMKQNFTRFLVLERGEAAQSIPGGNKASVHFHTDHSRGSLARVLTAIAAGGIKPEQIAIPANSRKRLEISFSCRHGIRFDG